MKRRSVQRPTLIERLLCHRCDAVTNWVQVKRSYSFRCEGCKMLWPCAHRCAHLECRTVRGDSLEQINVRGVL